MQPLQRAGGPGGADGVAAAVGTGPRAAPPGALAEPGNGQQPGPVGGGRGRGGLRRDRCGTGLRGRLALRAGRLLLRGRVLAAAGRSVGSAVIGTVVVGPTVRSAVRAGPVVRTAVRLLAGRLLQGPVQLLLVQAGRVEGVAPAAVREGQLCGGAHVLGGDRGASGPGGQGHGGAGHHDVSAQPVHLERGADGGDLTERRVPEHDRGQQCAGCVDPDRELLLLLRPALGETVRIGVVGKSAADHLGPLGRLPGGGDLDGQAESVQQLRPQLALLRVHRPDQQEPRRVPHRDALPLDVGAAHRGGVQQQVDQVVVEQVHLVDVEHAPVCGGEQPRLVGLDALGERPLQVQRADDPVLGHPDRQLHQPGGPLGGGRTVSMRAVRALRVRRGRVAGEAAALDRRDGGQQPGQRPHHGGLGGALLAAHQHPADLRRHRVEQQREAQVVHADDRGEGIAGVGHWSSPSRSPSSSR